MDGRGLGRRRGGAVEAPLSDRWGDRRCAHRVGGLAGAHAARHHPAAGGRSAAAPACPAGTLRASMGSESPKEECGLFAVWAPGDDVARLTYFGLFAQQHRGQESAGIAVSDGSNILVYKDLGLVSQVFNEATLPTLHGDLAVGHTLSSPTGLTTWAYGQPVFKTDGVRSLAAGHNGNLGNTGELGATVGVGAASTDSDLVTALIAGEAPNTQGLDDAAMKVMPMLQGAYCFVFMDERSIYAARDPFGVRPLSIGRLPNGFVIASETCALDIVGATWVRDVEPGEIVRVDDRGLHSMRFATSPRSARCIFEYVYLE